MRIESPSGIPGELIELGYDGDSWDKPWNLTRGQITTAERMPSAFLDPGGPATPWHYGSPWAVDELLVTDPLTQRTMKIGDFLESRLASDALMVVKNGSVVYEKYRRGMTESDQHLVHSCTKTLTTMMIGIAIEAGVLDPHSPMQTLVEELDGIDAWNNVTLQHVLDMATGLKTEEHYENSDSMYWRYADSVGYYDTSPGRQIGALRFAVDELRERDTAPGELFNYASYLTNLLPVVLERAYGKAALELYEEHLFSRIGAESEAILNLDSAGTPIVEGQLSLTLRDFARWSFPFVNAGNSLSGTRIIPEAWVESTRSSDPGRARAFARSEYADAFPGAEYHNKAWILDPPRGVIAMLGIHGQFAYADSENSLLIVGMSSFPDQANALLTTSMRALWSSISALAVQ